jgi:hypothetical protein
MVNGDVVEQKQLAAGASLLMTDDVTRLSETEEDMLKSLATL